MSLKYKKMNISNAKEATTNEIMAHYDNKNFTRKDVVNISLDTKKYNELDDEFDLNL